MALFGANVEQTFMKLHQARRHIEVAAQNARSTSTR
jgi:hypothetical protein